MPDDADLQRGEDQIHQSEIEQEPGCPAGSATIQKEPERGQDPEGDDGIRHVQLAPVRVIRLGHRPHGQVIEPTTQRPQHHSHQGNQAEPVRGFPEKVVGNVVPRRAFALETRRSRCRQVTDQAGFGHGGNHNENCLPSECDREAVLPCATVSGYRFAFAAASSRWRSSCSLSSGVSAGPKSSTSNTWRSSTVPSWKGARLSHSSASSFDRTCQSQ